MYCIGEDTNLNCARITKVALEVVTLLSLLKQSLSYIRTCSLYIMRMLYEDAWFQGG